MLKFVSFAVLILAVSAGHKRDTKPNNSPDNLWHDGVTSVDITFDLSDDGQFDANTVLQADCNVQFDRFEYDVNTYAVNFLANDQTLATYELINEFCKFSYRKLS